jgi:hypothetical protein
LGLYVPPHEPNLERTRMSAMVISGIVFACVFGGALLGMFLRVVLPAHHLSQDSKDVVKLGVGLIGTMAALVIGLLIASAKGSFDAVDNEIQQSGANVILLDRVLARYGPETAEIRDLIRRLVALRLNMIWPEDSSRTVQLQTLDKAPAAVESVEDKIRELAPRNDAQRSLQSRALQISGDLGQTRWLLFAQVSESPVPIPFLVVLVIWLTVIFASFGLFAPRNATVIAALVLCALSASGAIFLILEMGTPFDGLMKVSSAPVRYALSHLGQ